MNKFVLDSSAWIEYFDGSEAGKKIKNIIENKDNIIITCIINISEIMSIFRRRGYDSDEAYKLIISLSEIYKFDLDFAKSVGILHADIRQKKKSFSLADAFVLMTAKKLNAKVLTGDEDFRGLKDVIMIK